MLGELGFSAKSYAPLLRTLSALAHQQSLLRVKSDLAELAKANTSQIYIPLSNVMKRSDFQWGSTANTTTEATKPTAPDKPTD